MKYATLITLVAALFPFSGSAKTEAQSATVEGEVYVGIGEARDSDYDTVSVIDFIENLSIDVNATASQGAGISTAYESVWAEWHSPSSGAVLLDMGIDIHNPARISAYSQVQGGTRAWRYTFRPNVDSIVKVQYEKMGPSNIRFRLSGYSFVQLFSGASTIELPVRGGVSSGMEIDLFAGPNVSGIMREFSSTATLDLQWEIVPEVLAAIDIKPGSEKNPLNLSGRGVVPVAILGSDTFDTEDVDVTTLLFGSGRVPPEHYLNDLEVLGDHFNDVNNDGYIDLVTHYRTQEIGFMFGDSEACLSGRLLNRKSFEACDSVRVFGTRGARRSTR